MEYANDGLDLALLSMVNKVVFDEDGVTFDNSVDAVKYLKQHVDKYHLYITTNFDTISEVVLMSVNDVKKAKINYRSVIEHDGNKIIGKIIIDPPVYY